MKIREKSHCWLVFIQRLSAVRDGFGGGQQWCQASLEVRRLSRVAVLGKKPAGTSSRSATLSKKTKKKRANEPQQDKR